MSAELSSRSEQSGPALVDRILALFPYLLLGGCLLAAVLQAVRPLSDPDLWWHLRLGNELLDRRSFTTPPWDRFGTRPWTPSEPLPEAVIALAWRAGGLPAVTWLFGAVLCGVVLTWYAACRTVAQPLVAALVVALAMTAASRSLFLRPQLISFALLAVVVSAWLATERDGRARWGLVPLTWVWSMCHGFWFLGIGVGVLAWLTLVVTCRLTLRPALRSGLVLVGSALVVLLNPADFLGTGVLAAPLAVNDTKRYISEWQRTDLLVTPALVCAAMILVTLVLAARRRRLDLLRLLLLVVSAVLLWYADRFIAVAASIVVVLLAEALQGLLSPLTQAADVPMALIAPVVPGRRRREVPTAVVMTAVALVLLAVVAPAHARPGDVPTALDPALDELPRGTVVLDYYNIGGWMAWRHPDLTQAIDGLIVPYPNDYVDRYFAVIDSATRWQDFVTTIDARAAVLPPHSTLAGDMERAGWIVRSRDVDYVLLLAPGLNGGVVPGLGT